VKEPHRLLGELVLEGDGEGRVPLGHVHVQDLSPRIAVWQREA
jgi:hypothetical protein